eukprot:TRINITY_DN514_c0_g1_i1.p1 TRINITY_DN514_c0_g1~~TRINITY_DN514_c0_g1_i1.p1  ORF type:complete len:109 (+),score=27.54 TRINITY_DN514_c0_g1_i1:20-346(+)
MDEADGVGERKSNEEKEKKNAEEEKEEEKLVPLNTLRDQIRESWKDYEQKEKKKSCKEAFILSLMDDPRAKGKQVELVIYHSLNEDDLVLMSKMNIEDTSWSGLILLG